MSEEMNELDRLMAERHPPITVMDLKSGDIFTYVDRAEARRLIAFGKAVETVPTDPEQAKQWLVRVYERVVGEMHKAGAREPSKVLGREKSPMDVFSDFRAWCGENGFRVLPVSDVRGVVRYLLRRHSEGVQEAYIGAYANVIAAFHGRTSHPVMKAGEILRTPLEKVARDDFHRAMGFARRKAAIEDKRIDHNATDIAVRAMKMFPDGDIPVHWHEIAA